MLSWYILQAEKSFGMVRPKMVQLAMLMLALVQAVALVAWKVVPVEPDC